MIDRDQLDVRLVKEAILWKTDRYYPVQEIIIFFFFQTMKASILAEKAAK